MANNVIPFERARKCRRLGSHNPQAAAKEQHLAARITRLFFDHDLSVEKIVRREKVGSLFVQKVIRGKDPRPVAEMRRAA